MSELEYLKEALDHVDYALDILRKVARKSRTMADSLEDIIYHLEEAGDLLDSMISRGSSK